MVDQTFKITMEFIDSKNQYQNEINRNKSNTTSTSWPVMAKISKKKYTRNFSADFITKDKRTVIGCEPTLLFYYRLWLNY